MQSTKKWVTIQKHIRFMKKPWRIAQQSLPANHPTLKNRRKTSRQSEKEIVTLLCFSFVFFVKEKKNKLTEKKKRISRARVQRNSVLLLKIQMRYPPPVR